MCGLDAMLYWAGLFYWLRLFPTYAKYVNLIVRTVWDVKAFMILYLIGLGAFANAYLILDFNATAYEFDFDAHPEIPNLDPVVATGGKFIDDNFPLPFLNAFINAYLLGLGDFDTDSSNDNPYFPFVWTIFLIGTFMLMLLLLNMVVAIMAETFGSVMEAWALV